MTTAQNSGYGHTTARLLPGWLDRYPATTQDGYRRDLNQFHTWHGADPLTATRADIQRWIAHLTKRLRPPTIRRKIAALSSYLTYAVEEGAITTNPAATTRRPSGTTPARLGLTQDEARQLTTAATTHSPTALALILTLLTTGCRISEAVNADIEDLATDSNHHVLRLQRKGGRDARVPIAPPVHAAIRTATDGRTTGPLFTGKKGHRLSRQRAAQILNHLADQAGVANVHPHRLRHTAATLALRNGAGLLNVQKLLGHASPETTERYLKAIDTLDDSPAYQLATNLLEDRP